MYLPLVDSGGKGVTAGQGKFFSIDCVEHVLHEAESGNEPAQNSTLIETLTAQRDMIVNPIYRWSTSEIWEYIQTFGVKTNPLYYPPYNYTRVGCVMCPMASYREKKKMEQHFPGFKRMYIKAFNKMLEEREKRGLVNKEAWTSGEEVYKWWIQEYQHNIKGQISLEEWLEHGTYS